MPSSGVCDEIVKQCSGIATTSSVSEVRPAGRLRTAMKFHPASAQFLLISRSKKTCRYAHESGPAPEQRDWVGAEKYLEVTDQFYPHFREGRPKKKVFILAIYLFSGHKFRSGMGGMLLSVGALRNLMVRISRLDNKFRREDQKKVLRCEILDVVLGLGVHSCFLS